MDQSRRVKSARLVFLSLSCFEVYYINFQLPEIAISIPEDLSTRVTEYVRSCGLELPEINETSATPEAPTSLLTDVKLAQFPVSEICSASNISWAPPLQNWNPWRASNIDEEPLAFVSFLIQANNLKLN